MVRSFLNIYHFLQSLMTSVNSMARYSLITQTVNMFHVKKGAQYASYSYSFQIFMRYFPFSMTIDIPVTSRMMSSSIVSYD